MKTRAKAKVEALILLAGLVLLVSAGAASLAGKEDKKASSKAEFTPAGLAAELGIVVHPQAKSENAAQNEVVGRVPAKGRLVVRSAEFLVRAPYKEVAEWYRRELGPAFIEYAEEYRPLPKRQPVWAKEFDLKGYDIDIRGVIFAREEAGRAVGLTLEPSSDGRGTDLSVFEIREDIPK